MFFNDHSQNSSALPQAVVALCLAIGAIWVNYPIKPDRPDPQEGTARAYGFQDVDARLWQDPFGAVERVCPAGVDARAQEKPEDGKCNGETGLKKLQIWIQGKAGAVKGSDTKTDDANAQKKLASVHSEKGLQVLLAMVPGGSWVGANEVRRRTRYAVLSGLKAEGYLPDDPEHVGFAMSKPCPMCNSEMVIPYERLTHEKGKNPLLLVWIDDEALEQEVVNINSPTESAGKDTPLHRLLYVMRTIAGDTESAKGGNNIDDNLDSCLRAEKVKWLLIGPSRSEFLEASLKNAKGYNEAAQELNRIVSRWYSPQVTVPEQTLQQEEIQPELNKLLRSSIADDDMLTEALVQELALRRFGSGKSVALVGQWDTGYSRSLRDLLRQKINKSYRNGGMQVHTYSYLRGLDGRLPGKKNGDSEKGEGKKEQVQSDRPEGEGQLDYLRRMAMQMKERERREGRIGAIGVLGNDYYDKLLVLKALRPVFPDSVFFTTDMDAAMLSREDNSHTRNLIVATGYGLQLPFRFQLDTPPFRDSYQTSTYVAVRQALATPWRQAIKPAEQIGSAPGKEGVRPERREDLSMLMEQLKAQPLVYEIGRSKAVRLAPSLERDQHGLGWANKIFGPSALVLLIWAIAWIVGITRREGRCYWTLVLLAVFVLSVLLFFVEYTDEPLLWMEGVSTWPSELLRLVALMLSLILFIRGFRLTHEAHDEISLDYFPDSAVVQGNGSAGPRDKCAGASYPFCLWLRRSMTKDWSVYTVVHGAWRSIKAFAKRVELVLKERDAEAGTPESRNVTDLWAVYTGRSSTQDANGCDSIVLLMPFWLSGALFIVIYMTMVSVLRGFDMGNPVTPARGEFAFFVDSMIIKAAVIGFLTLLYLALHQSFRAVWLARNLQGPTVWPEALLQKYRRDELEERAGAADGKENARENGASKPIYSVDENALLDPWLDVRFLAEVTEPLQRIIFYPFVVLSLLILARTSVFDRWAIPPLLVIVFVFSASLLVLAATRMRRFAEKLRRRSIQILEDQLVVLRGKEDEALLDRIRAMITEVKECRIGVFSPLSQHPLLKAVIMLVSSVSGVAILDYTHLAAW